MTSPPFIETASKPFGFENVFTISTFSNVLKSKTNKMFSQTTNILF